MNIGTLTIEELETIRYVLSTTSCITHRLVNTIDLMDKFDDIIFGETAFTAVNLVPVEEAL